MNKFCQERREREEKDLSGQSGTRVCVCVIVVGMFFEF